MSAPIPDDGNDSELSKYGPKPFRDPTTPSSSAETPSVPSTPTAPLPKIASQDRRTTSDFSSWPEPVPEPPPPPHRLEDGTSTLIGRIALVGTFAAVVALKCPLLGVKRTLLGHHRMSASGPKRTRHSRQSRFGVNVTTSTLQKGG
jgi:hypothetical protein